MDLLHYQTRWCVQRIKKYLFVTKKIRKRSHYNDILPDKSEPSVKTQ
jgi:hypothetical protein